MENVEKIVPKVSNTVIEYVINLIKTQKLTCEKVFYGFDVDKRYSLNFKNFKEFLKIVDEDIKEDVVKEIFETFANKSYKEIGIKEFKKMLGFN